MTSQEKRDHTRYNCSCQKKEKVRLHVRQKVRQSYTLSRLFGHFFTVRKYKLVAVRGRLHPPSPWWAFFLFLNSVDGVLLVYLLFCFQKSDLSQVGNVMSVLRCSRDSSGAASKLSGTPAFVWRVVWFACVFFGGLLQWEIFVDDKPFKSLNFLTNGKETIASENG